jgi:hypothetical protein
MQNLQENHGAADSQNNGQPSQWCRGDSMHQVRSNGRCTDRQWQCQRMNLNARCAKSVLRWISQSMRNDNQSAAGQT